MRVAMTYDLAMAAANDAASRQAKKNGRQAWSVEDYNLSCEVFEKLWPAPHPDRRD